MSKTKSSGTTKLGRDSGPKYLGLKLNAGQKAKAGMIIIRQRGTKYLPGINVGKGSDDTLYATKEGIVYFKTIKKTKFDNSKRITKVVNVK